MNPINTSITMVQETITSPLTREDSSISSTVPRSSTLEFLRHCQPFSRMDLAHLEWVVERMKASQYAAGDIVLSPRDAADRLFFVASGVVRMEAIGRAISADKKLLAELTEGECFPIEALQEQRPVFSIFRADGDVTCYTLDSDQFAELVAMSSIFREFCESRAESFLDSSRRLYHSHFARQTEAAAFLAARLGSLKCRKPTTCRDDETIRAAISKLDESRDGALVIVDKNNAPVGVFTLHDLLRRVLLKEGSLDQLLLEVMSPELVTLAPDADGYEAAMAMAENGVQQVLIVEHGRLIGAVTERDLFSLQRVALSQLSSRLREANSLPALRLLTGEIGVLAANLMSQGLAAGPLMRIISSLNDHLTHRAIELEIKAHNAPLPRFCWIALGSEGRHEQTLYTDQDNGIIFDPAGLDPEAARAALLPVAEKINHALASCGFPLCKGGVMASNPSWCLSLLEWRDKFLNWLEHPEPEALLNATIFFDFRPLYGDTDLSRQLSDWLMAAAPKQDRFFRNLVPQALQRTPPLGFFRDFVVDQDAAHPDTLDLKLYGATIFVDAARILSLKSGVAHSNTARRISAAAEVLGINRSEAGAWIDAFHFIQLLRLRRQYELLDQGEEPHNRINPDELNELDRKVLLEAFRQARKMQKSLELRFGQSAGF